MKHPESIVTPSRSENRGALRLASIWTLAVYLLISWCAQSVSAQTPPTLYTSRTAWTAASSGVTSVGFEGISASGTSTTFGTATGLTISGVNFVGSVPSNSTFPNYLFVVDPAFAPTLYNWGSGAVLLGPPVLTGPEGQGGPGSKIRVTLPAGVTAAGSDIMSVIAFASAFQVTVTTSAGSSSFTVSSLQFPNRAFVGFTSSLPILSMEFVGLSGFPILDNFSFGTSGGTGPVLSVSPTLLQFSGVAGGSAQTLSVGVTTASSTSFTASAVVLNGANWLSVSPASGSTASTGITTESTTGAAAASSRLSVVVNFAALTAGLFEGDVSVTAGTATVKAHVSVSVTTSLSRLVVTPQAMVFTAAENGVAPRSREVRIFNPGQASLQWSSSLSDAAPWLSLTQTSGAAGAGGSSATTLTVNPAGRVAGVYQTRLTVTAPGAANSPQEVAVTLHVVPGSAAARADLSPSGMVFVTQVGGSALVPQALTVSNAGGGSFTFTLALSTAPWASLSQTTGNTALGPVQIQVSANATGLVAGIYRGKITMTPSSGAAQEVEVVLVVAPAGTFLQRELPSAAACTAQSMDLAATTIGNGTNLPVSFPRSLLALAVDNCGGSVSNATVVANVEGLAITMQGVGSGQYSGTWTPVKESASVAMSIVATHPTLGTVSRNYTLATSAAAGGVALPVVSENGVKEAAGLTPQRPLAPGSIISIAGSQFATGNNVATTVPLAQSLGGTSVRIGNENAPLYYVGPEQINAQVPFTAKVGESVSVVVIANGKLTAPQNYLIAAAQPGIFQAGGVAAVVDSQGRNITAANPARIGETIQIFSNGLGLVDQTVAAGAVSPSANALLAVTATVGGVEVPVSYAGLAPGFVGLYRVDVQLTSGVPTGDAVAVVLRQNGIASNPNLPVSIPIR